MVAAKSGNGNVEHNKQINVMNHVRKAARPSWRQWIEATEQAIEFSMHSLELGMHQEVKEAS